MAHTKIDLHAHFLPPSYTSALFSSGYEHPDGMPVPPEWNVSSHLAFMRANSISKSVLSISSPGIELTQIASANAALARACNDYGASIKQQYPNDFGYFASLPLSDVNASVAEIRRLDKFNISRKPDGFVLLTNGGGRYLGDPSLRPVLEELDKRKALVFLHPTLPCNHGLHQERIQPYSKRYNESSPLATMYPAPIYEFFFDSARSIIDMLVTGTTIRFSRIRWIVSHCGDVLPSLIDRVLLFMRLSPSGSVVPLERDALPVNETTVRQALREHFWYDLAGYAVPNMLEAMLKFTGIERIVFGSDTPWTSWKNAGMIAEQIESDLGGVVGTENVDKVWDGTARKLLGPLEY